MGAKADQWGNGPGRESDDALLYTSSSRALLILVAEPFPQMDLNAEMSSHTWVTDSHTETGKTTVGPR